MIAFKESGKLEVLDSDLFSVLLKNGDVRRKRKKSRLSVFWPIRPKKPLRRRSLRRSQNIDGMEYPLLSGVMVKWLLSPQTRLLSEKVRSTIRFQIRRK
jgi:hypothetical protein